LLRPSITLLTLLRPTITLLTLLRPTVTCLTLLRATITCLALLLSTITLLTLLLPTIALLPLLRGAIALLSRRRPAVTLGAKTTRTLLLRVLLRRCGTRESVRRATEPSRRRSLPVAGLRRGRAAEAAGPALRAEAAGLRVAELRGRRRRRAELARCGRPARVAAWWWALRRAAEARAGVLLRWRRVELAAVWLVGWRTLLAVGLVGSWALLAVRRCLLWVVGALRVERWLWTSIWRRIWPGVR